jgi:hypothetical protein
LSSIRATWPAHLRLLDVITFNYIWNDGNSVDFDPLTPNDL